MKTHLALAATAALLTLAATAVGAADKPAKADKNECFWTRSIQGFSAPDDHTVYVRASSRDIYKFDLMGACPDVDWNQRIALVSRSGSNICSGMDAEIVSHATGLGAQRCPVSHMHKLTPEEIAALPRKSLP
jgi:hypothetical protein